METFSVFAANKMSDGLEEQCVYKSALFTCKSPVLYILQMQGLVMSCWDITFQVFCTLYSLQTSTCAIQTRATGFRPRGSGQLFSSEAPLSKTNTAAQKFFQHVNRRVEIKTKKLM